MCTLTVCNEHRAVAVQLTGVHALSQFPNLVPLGIVDTLVAVDEGQVGLGGHVGGTTVPAPCKHLHQQLTLRNKGDRSTAHLHGNSSPLSSQQGRQQHCTPAWQLFTTMQTQNWMTFWQTQPPLPTTLPSMNTNIYIHACERPVVSALSPGSRYLEPAPCFCLSFYLSVLLNLKNLSLLKRFSLVPLPWYMRECFFFLCVCVCVCVCVWWCCVHWILKTCTFKNI